MLSSVLSLPADVAQKLDRYSKELSTSLSPALTEHFEWTRDNFEDADRSSSLLQAQWMSQRAYELQAKRVLDVGCYTGLSALAWHTGTKHTNAQILTIENMPEMAATAREAFHRLGCDDRVKVLEGAAESVIAELTDPFDVIFVDLEFSGYRSTVEQILDRHLLTPNGVIIVDNVFARGFAVDSANCANIDAELLPHWIESGQLVREFNAFVAADPRVTVTMLPLFDGISEIRLRA